MKELNFSNLQNALRQLPAHQPPEEMWASIETQLLLDKGLPNPAEGLPKHSPPPDVWSQIEAQLQQEADQPPFRPHPGGWWGRRLGAAAVITLLLYAGWWTLRQTIGEPLQVSQEIVDNRVLETLAEKDDSAFEIVQRLCREQQPVCQNPEFRYLKAELDELTEARSSLRDALGPYGNNPELVGRLVEIERERSRILNTLVTMI